MSTTLKISETTKNFGRLNKVIWFTVSDVDGTYSIDLHISPSQTEDINLIIFNQGTGLDVSKKTHKKSSNTTIINDTIKIRHTPGLNSPIYGLKTI
jgi:hypothetical protein